MVTIYAGPVRSGKTTALRARLEAAPRRAALGVLAPDVDGRRTLVSLATGAARRLEADRPADPVAVGRFTFDGAVFAWARGEILAAVAARPETLVVDEVGPLELDGRGLAPAVDAAVCLGVDTEARVLLVVREALVDRVLDRYGLRGVAVTEQHVPWWEAG